MKNYSTTTILAKITRSALALAGAGLLILGQSAQAATDTYLDTTTDGEWSTGTNWNNGQPQSGDSLVFGATTVANNLFTNTGLPINFVANGITFTGAAPSDTFTGNSIQLAGTVDNESGVNQTFAETGGVTVSGTLTFTGNGSVSLQTGVVNSSPSGGITLNNDTGTQVFINGIQASSSITPTTITLNGDGAGGFTTINGTITNGAAGAAVNVVYHGTGILNLSGSNAFSGGLTVDNGGTVVVRANATAVGTGTINLSSSNAAASSTLNLRNSSDATMSNDVVLSGFTDITSDNDTPGSAGTTYTLGALTTAVNTTLTIGNAPNITSGTAGVTFSGTATIGNGTTVAFAAPNAGVNDVLTLAGPLSTTAASVITTSGSGTLVLSSASNLVGELTEMEVGSGTSLNLEASGALGVDTAGILVDTTGVVNIDSDNTIIALLGAGTTNISGTNTLTLANFLDTDEEYSGVIAGTGNLTISGSDTASSITLSGNNVDLTGTVTLNSGSLHANADNATGTGALVINGGTTIDNTSGSGVTLANSSETWTGDFTYGGTSNLNLGTGPISLNPTLLGTTAVTVTNDSTTHRTLTIGGDITSTGTTGLTINTTHNGRTVITGDLNITGSFINIGSGSGTTVVTGVIGSTVGTQTVVSGPFVSVTQDSAGTLVLVGDNTYTGATVIDSGTVVAASSSALGINSAVVMSPILASGGTPAELELHRSISIGSLTDGAADGDSNDDIVSLGHHTLTIGGDGTSPGAFGGTITGSGSISKVGDGTLYLNGSTSTYSGGTSLTGGTIELGASSQFNGPSILDLGNIVSGPLGTGALAVDNDTTLTTDGLGSSPFPGYQLGNNVDLGTNTLTVTPSGTTGLWLSGVISGTGTLNITGTSTVYLTGNDRSPGSATPDTYVGNSYGDTHIGGGEVIIGTGTVDGTVPEAITPFGTGTVYVDGASVLTTDGGTAASSAFLNGIVTDNNYSIDNDFVLGSTLTVIVPKTISDGPQTLTMNGVISGADGLTVGDTTGLTGGGTLILTNTETYTGTTTIVADNTLALVSQGGSAPSLSGGGTVIDDGTFDISGALQNETIGSLSGTNTGLVILGDENLTTGGDNTNTIYAGAFTGTGTLTKTGDGSFYLTGASNGVNGLHGDIVVNDGLLVVGNHNALGNGNVFVNGADAALISQAFGHGFFGVGTPYVDNALIISVGGNYTQLNGGQLGLDVTTFAATPVAGTDYDVLAVTGTATIGAGTTIDLNFEAHAQIGQQFEVIAANTQVNGSTKVSLSGEVTTDQVNDSVTTYNDTFGGKFTGGSVVVTILQPFTSLGQSLTPNQTSVAGGVQSAVSNMVTGGVLVNPTATQLDFFNNIVVGGLTTAAVNGNLGHSLDELSPQRFQLLRNIAYDNNAFDVQTLDDEFARERNGPGGFDTSGFAFNDSRLGSQLSGVKSRLLAWSPQSDPGLLSDSNQNMLSGVTMADSKDVKNVSTASGAYSKWNGFLDGGADLGSVDSNSDISDSSYTTARIRIGGDYAVTENLRVGLLFGYSHTNADLDNEGSKAKVNSYMPGIFITYADKSGFFANGIFTGGVNDYKTDRNINIPGVSRTATANSNGVQFGGDIDGGYEFHKGDFTFGPSAGLTYVNMGIDSFTESGADSADLAVANQSSDSLRSRLGGSISYKGKVGSVGLTPHIDAFWQHEFLDKSGNINSSFAGLPGSGFSVSTTQGDKNNALVGVGLDADLDQHFTLFIDYQAEAGGSTFFGQSISGGAKCAF